MRSGVTSSTGWPSWVGRNPALWCPEREVGKAPPLAPQLNHATAPLIATDGVEYYVGVMVRLLGSACVSGQVLKTRRNTRVVRVERRVTIGTASRLNAALLASEDAETLNTSFIERLNLTIRHGSAYVRRRSPCHARGADQLRGHVELLRCYDNFIRPHRALRFGRETRTPAMQAGLVSQRLALRDIFTAGGLTRRIFVALVRGCGQAYALQTVEPVTSRCGTRRVCQARSAGSERDTRARPHAVAPMNCVPEDSRRRSTCTGSTHSPRARADGHQTPSSTVAVRAPSPS